MIAVFLRTRLLLSAEMPRERKAVNSSRPKRTRVQLSVDAERGVAVAAKSCRHGLSCWQTVLRSGTGRTLQVQSQAAPVI